jgi:hypothetical protein
MLQPRRLREWSRLQSGVMRERLSLERGLRSGPVLQHGDQQVRGDLPVYAGCRVLDGRVLQYGNGSLLRVLPDERAVRDRTGVLWRLSRW